jgi:hypothetical protein
MPTLEVCIAYWSRGRRERRLRLTSIESSCIPWDCLCIANALRVPVWDIAAFAKAVLGA